MCSSYSDGYTTCTFERGICEWEQLHTDELDWHTRQGMTRTPWTGPAMDHTTGTTVGEGQCYVNMKKEVLLSGLSGGSLYNCIICVGVVSQKITCLESLFSFFPLGLYFTLKVVNGMYSERYDQCWFLKSDCCCSDDANKGFLLL